MIRPAVLSPARVLRRVLVVWCVLAVLMSVNGIVREQLLKRLVAPGAADVLSALLGVAIILAVTARGFRGALAGQPGFVLWRVSVLLVALTVGFEFLIGRAVDHKSWSELAANYALWRGRLWPVVLLVLAATPPLWSRWSPRDRAAVRRTAGA